MNDEEYALLSKLIDYECNKCILKQEFKEPIILVNRKLKDMLRLFYNRYRKSGVKNGTN